MNFEYSCFISYCHGQQQLTKRFIDQLKEALKACLEPWLDEEVYIDEERLLPGYRYNEALARAMCRSICWIVVYSPRYERHSYCLREYAAMERIEQSRMELLGDQAPPDAGMIIPIVFRGVKDDMPTKLRDSIHYIDFSKFAVASPNILGNAEYEEEINKVAEVIYQHYRTFKDLEDMSNLCDAFELPSDEEIEPWRKSGREAVTPFPGRKERS